MGFQNPAPSSSHPWCPVVAVTASQALRIDPGCLTNLTISRNQQRKCRESPSKSKTRYTWLQLRFVQVALLMIHCLIERLLQSSKRSCTHRSTSLLEWQWVIRPSPQITFISRRWQHQTAIWGQRNIPRPSWKYNNLAHRQVGQTSTHLSLEVRWHQRLSSALRIRWSKSYQPQKDRLKDPAPWVRTIKYWTEELSLVVLTIEYFLS